MRFAIANGQLYRRDDRKNLPIFEKKLYFDRNIISVGGKWSAFASIRNEAGRRIRSNDVGNGDFSHAVNVQSGDSSSPSCTNGFTLETVGRSY